MFNHDNVIFTHLSIFSVKENVIFNIDQSNQIK